MTCPPFPLFSRRFPAPEFLSSGSPPPTMVVHLLAVFILNPQFWSYLFPSAPIFFHPSEDLESSFLNLALRNLENTLFRQFLLTLRLSIFLAQSLCTVPPAQSPRTSLKRSFPHDASFFPFTPFFPGLLSKTQTPQQDRSTTLC